MNPVISKHSIAIGLFVLLSIVGVYIAQDYGACWDSPIQRDIGLKYYNYVFEGDKSLNSYIERDHGSGFELPLIILERIANTKSTASIFHLRSVTTHLFFLISAFIFYLLSSGLFNNRLIGLIGFLALVLHPRLYTHSFFNTKDIPFLSAIIITLYCILLAYKNKSTISYLLLGIAVGYATSIRLMSLALIALICLLLLIDIIKGLYTRTDIKKTIVQAVVFLSTTTLTLYLCWPTLWEQPFVSFVDVLKDMSKFRWPGIVLFEGIFYKGADVPWYYLAKYIMITTPLLWVGLGVVGSITYLIYFVHKPLQALYDSKNRFLFTNLALFTSVLLSIIVLQSVVYDGWRHVFFIYPSFLIMALYLLHRLQKSKGNKLVFIVCGVQIVATGWFLYNNHPYQMCYFNKLIPQTEEYIRHHYDMDYWGISAKQGIDKLLSIDTSNKIKVVSYPPPVNINTENLIGEQRKRIQLLECEEGATYFITNFREHPQDYKFKEIIYEQKTLNSTILRIYKLEENNETYCNAIWQ